MTLRYARFGDGPEPVLFLPDWFGGSAFCKPLDNLVDTDSFTYVVADYRGYGESRDQTGSYTIREMASDALELADALRWQRFHIVGHSMSGKVVQLLAASACHRLKSAIALTPTPPIALSLDEGTRGLLQSCETSRDSRKTALRAATGSQYSDAFISRLADISFAASRPGAYRAYLDAWANTDITPDFKSTDFPLRIIIGAKDPFVPESAMRETVMKAFRKAELVVLENVGHYPLLEVPPLTVSLFESWFKIASGA